jgi:hypothetical protein
MEKLIYILQNLPLRDERLKNGLALWLTRGNGWAVLGCSRVGVSPSESEMDTIQRAVVEAFGPQRIWRGPMPTEPVTYHEVDHYIWRLYWNSERIELVYEELIHEEFLF